MGLKNGRCSCSPATASLDWQWQRQMQGRRIGPSCMIEQDCLIDLGAVGSVVVQLVAELGVDHSAVVDL